LRYGLNRRQRLVPHVRIWGWTLTLVAPPLLLFFLVQTTVSTFNAMWLNALGFGVLAFLLFLFLGEFFLGLFDALLIPVRHMDVIIEDNAAGIMLGKERWYLFLDGITELRKFRDDVWTIRHFNGFVLHIAADAIHEELIAHIRAAMERGQTPEGIQAAIERGKRIREIENEM
jgi:hypothetical protein